jgi:small ligand-binding sensory domain FIST
MDEAFPDAVKVGGMASGAEKAGQNRLFLNDQVLRQGLVGVGLQGPVRIDTVVSQGCRPVGPALSVTRGEADTIEELDHRDAGAVLKEVFLECSEEEQGLMQRGVFVGLRIDGRDPGAGEYLVRNVVGIQGESTLKIGGQVHTGQTVRFHVRDAASATDEMTSLLSHKAAQLDHAPLGGLLFSCNGRGRRMFSRPHHDIALVNKTFDGCQVGGCFAAGEIGPVGGQTFIHGFTSSLILFRGAD